MEAGESPVQEHIPLNREDLQTQFIARTIGDGKRGPITTRLQAMYFDVVNGRSPKHRGWLTQVY